MLDLFLAQEAERMGKITGAVERVEEQCHPLNGLNFSQVRGGGNTFSHWHLIPCVCTAGIADVRPFILPCHSDKQVGLHNVQ